MLLKQDTAASMAVEAIEKPFPKPSDEKYVEARLLEALVSNMRESVFVLPVGALGAALDPSQRLSSPVFIRVFNLSSSSLSRAAIYAFHA